MIKKNHLLSRNIYIILQYTYMKQEFEIKDLIQKFNKGDITQEELRYLVTYFKEKEPMLNKRFIKSK